MKRLPDLPPFWTLCAWVLSLVISWVIPNPSWDSLGLRWLGLLWIILAFVSVAWSALVFFRYNTTIEPGQKPYKLITNGPFQFSRNPIYLSMVVATAGWVLWLGAAFGLAVIPVLWFILDRRFAALEEAVLRETFGEEAEAFFTRTRRWL
ncbi:MAG: isoprenylcysteine carboxylmethyltransferase family protein [Pseudomonadota bacterium]